LTRKELRRLYRNRKKAHLKLRPSKNKGTYMGLVHVSQLRTVHVVQEPEDVDDEKLISLMRDMAPCSRVDIVTFPDFRIYFAGDEEEKQRITSILTKKGYKTTSSDSSNVVGYAGDTTIKAIRDAIEDLSGDGNVSVESTTWDKRVKEKPMIVYKIARVEGGYHNIDEVKATNHGVLIKLKIPQEDASKMSFISAENSRLESMKLRFKRAIPTAMAELVVHPDKPNHLKLDTSIKQAFGSRNFQYDVGVEASVLEFGDDFYRRGCGVGIHAFMHPKQVFDYFGIRMDSVVGLCDFVETDHFQKVKDD